MKKALSLILALVLLIGLVPQITLPVSAAEPAESKWAGKIVSILSHSMSTYAGVSNSTAANSTLGSNDVYYTAGRHDVYREDTWWQQVIDALDMELLVNNSWSGSCVFMPRKGEASVGYGDRAVNLHNDHTGEEPDIIFVYLGCNDFAYYKDTFGEAADVNYAALITDNGDGTFTYATPTTTCEAYAIMLHKAEHRYPDAEIYCMTSTARRETDYTGDTYPDAGQPTAYSAELQKVAQYFGYPVVDLENAIVKDVEIFDKYMGDKRAHANALGMDQIANEVLSVMLGKDAEICHVTSEDGTVQEQAVLLGGSYYTDIELQEGYSVIVTMDGEDVTDEVCNNGKISIEKVTGDIAICTTIQRDPFNFRWEMQEDALISIGDTDNALSKLAGTVTNGVLNNTRYQLATSVVLKHDLPWEVEWQFSGNWRGCVFTSDPVQNTKGMVYLSRTNGGQLCFGTWTGSQYDNYGVDLSYLDDQVHTYRFVNRIAADGSNMVWVYVDGEEIGPMNHYYIGSKDQGKTSDWISGKDFVFSYISMDGHALKDCQLDYLQVQECIHTYESGICTACGAAQWDTDGDGVLEILAIGNSFSVDALQYAYQIAQDLGIKEIVLGNLYIGGCSLNTHATNAAGDLAKYTYYYNDNGTWTSTKSYKISTALESRSWDYVSLQQASNYSGVESTYNEDLTDLIAYVKDRSDAKLVWHMTWAYQQNSTHSAFPTYNKDQMTMYNAIVSAVQNKIGTNGDFDLIVPNGTAVQNSRTSLLGDTTTRDGYHMSYDYGRYLTGLLFVKTITGLSIDGVTYAPSGVDAEERAIAIESANNASAKPFAVTKSKYVNEVPDEGYILLKPELYKGAFWHPLKAGSYNELIDDQSNSPNFFTTIRFTRETLPVGSIITLKSGWQYRPDGWVTDALQTGTRESATTKAFLIVTEEWWGDYTIRSFNISRTSGGSVMDLTEEEMRSIFQIYVPEEKHTHSYENGVCILCGAVVNGGIWQIIENSKVAGAYADLQSAVNACEDGGTIYLTENCIVTSGAAIEKNITIDGGNHLADISGCSNAFITVAEGAEVTICNLMLDGGADGFEVDYDAVTYTNYTIPLVAGSLDNDPKASQSAIISSGTLICENVDISNRYTASVGGAMQILAGSVTLTDCDFTHNYGTSKGGALYIGSNLGTRTDYPVERVTITGCTFTNNYTGHGGAIYAYNMTEMVIESTDFTGNTANGGKGGAIDLFSETTQPTAAMALGLNFMQTTIRDCVFTDNWAGNDGFAIQSYDSDLYIYDSVFIENVGVHPTSSVGTVSIETYRHADTSWRIYTLLDGCLFEGNQGPCAVYGDHSSISDLDVSNCVFRNNVGNDSFLLYAATTNMSNCQFIGETMTKTVIDARIYENYQVPPLLTLTDVTFTDCEAPTEILTRKQNHNGDLNTYTVILQGTTNGDITIWDNNAVMILGNHSGNVKLDYETDRSSLTISNDAIINGIILTEIADAETVLGERFCVRVEAEGENLTYQWYFRNAGSSVWYKSSVKDNTYDDVMTKARAGREVYCVITDANGNKVTTDIVKLICLPSEELAITQQPTDGEAVLGERYCVTVEAKGEGLKYQWYFRNKGAKNWTKSSVTDNTYDDIMTTARDGREVYCVITDLAGNKVTTDIVKLVRVPMKLEITSQPTDAEAAFGEMFCATVEAKGEGLKYQWYYRNAGTNTWHKSGVRDNTYDDIMTKARNGREVYCVITDKYGNTVTTDIVKLIAVPSVELKLLGQSYESAAIGERYCVTVNAQGEGLTYQWYFRNAGATRWSKSSVKDNTYDDVMNKTRANREVYCVITDAFGNQIVTEVVTLVQFIN